MTDPYHIANNDEDIEPLIELCKAGRLFEVQAWVASGKAVNRPPPDEKKARKKSPLQVAIEVGFHSMVQVLLESGASVKDDTFNALEHALIYRRLDLIQLLVAHGADIHSVDMVTVFETWQPAIMEFFIDQGADVETGFPLAIALSGKIRTALGVVKRHKARFPSFQEQLNVALRYHCREGSLKWVSLLLWAGADPYAKGPDTPTEDPEPHEDLCALAYAALYENFEIFKLKAIRIAPDQPIAGDLLRYACHAKESDFLMDLLKKGFNPIDQKDCGSSLIQTCLRQLPWSFDFSRLEWGRDKDIDTARSRETIKMIHILAKHGAKWTPVERYEINDARRALLKMSVDYTVEFVWIMSKYEGCSLATIEQLLKTQAIRRHTARHKSRLDELLKDFPQVQKPVT